MKLLFKESFAQDLNRLTDKRLLGRVKRVIEAVGSARTIEEIPHIKKLRESGNCFRTGKALGQYESG